MITIKEIAGVVIAKEWLVGEQAFDAIWLALSQTAISEIREFGDHQYAHPMLAGNSQRTETITVAVLAFVKLLEVVAEETTIEQLMPELNRICEKLGDPGLGVRLCSSCKGTFERGAIVGAERSRHTIAYTHEDISGRTLNATSELTRLVDAKSNYSLFIWHQKGLGDGIAGLVYFHGIRASDLPGQRLTVLHYRILKHVLAKRDQEAQRTAANLVEHCWAQIHQANSIRNIPFNQGYRFQTDTGFIRKAATALNRTLVPNLGIKLRTKGTGIYGLDPWPTYCLIDEEQRLQK